MARMALRRALSSITALAVLGVVIFLLLRATPGNFAYAALAAEPEITEKMIRDVEHEYGLDRSIPAQFVAWTGDIASGNLGDSFYFRKPVADMIMGRIGISLELMVGALGLSIPAGVTLGIVSAVRRNSFIDYLARGTAIAGIGMPQFVLGIIVLFVLLRFFAYSPPFAYTAFVDDPKANLQQFFWPVLILAVGPTASISRLTRSQMLEVLREDYIRTAMAKGLRPRAVIMRHALRNALSPVLALIATIIGALVGGAVVIERLFSLPGMGTALVSGVNYHDYPLVQGIVLFVGLGFIVTSLTLDVCVGWLDPRVRDAAR